MCTQNFSSLFNPLVRWRACVCVCLCDFVHSKPEILSHRGKSFSLYMFSLLTLEPLQMETSSRQIHTRTHALTRDGRYVCVQHTQTHTNIEREVCIHMLSAIYFRWRRGRNGRTASGRGIKNRARKHAKFNIRPDGSDTRTRALSVVCAKGPHISGRRRPEINLGSSVIVRTHNYCTHRRHHHHRCPPPLARCARRIVRPKPAN